MYKRNKSNFGGYSLIELLVVLVVFSFITLISVQALLTVLVSTHKADAVSKVRQNLDFAMETISRQLYNSRLISQCPNTDTTQISFTDTNENTVTFSCVNTNNSNQASSIASSSGTVAPSPVPITSADVNITSCSFVCAPGTSTIPPTITISVSGRQLTGAGTNGITGAQNNAVVNVTTQVTLRTY